MSSADYDAIVIGGGFYGCFLALHLRRERGARVGIVEQGAKLLTRASYVNQARVHNGYHYPRSLLTGYRSRVNYERFVADFRDCVDDDVESYYAIARTFSNVTARQFELFCDRIGADYDEADETVRGLFNTELVERVVRVREAVFDASKLRERVTSELAECSIEVVLETTVEHVAARANDGGLDVQLSSGEALGAMRVYNCTYSRTNRLLFDSGIAPVALKHQLTELALVEVPPALRNRAITIMCGPFFSALPFPSRGLHSVSHVRYTPHCEWLDATTAEAYHDPYQLLEALAKASSYVNMLKDASRYLPLLAESRYIGSLWEIKTVLPRNSVDDGRPILIRADHDVAGLTSIMGSKIDNVYDMIDVVSGDATTRVAP